MQLQESGEMYLEAILILSRQQPKVRAVDVGEYRGYSKPSVSRAMSLLRQGGFVDCDAEGCLTLTPTGREVAEKIYERHTVLHALLTALGVPEPAADEDACRIEHVISDQTFSTLSRFLERKLGKEL